MKRKCLCFTPSHFKYSYSIQTKPALTTARILTIYASFSCAVEKFCTATQHGAYIWRWRRLEIFPALVLKALSHTSMLLVCAFFYIYNDHARTVLLSTFTLLFTVTGDLEKTWVAQKRQYILLVRSQNILLNSSSELRWRLTHFLPLGASPFSKMHYLNKQ